MTRYLCIHSHFYQPPRENPWLESIEMQDSAYPYHDWNARITAECYHPNAAARILDGKDRIARIVNNYASISFNAGPTLAAWLEIHSPETYAKLLEADRISRKRCGGHGNAIAQVYNHVIMPLANRRDKETQVIWGIADFQRRFRRKPEGMWLAETAVDLESLDIMAQHGILFTILSPTQAKSAVDTRQPYRVQLPSGRSIAVFFYNGPISQSVAFERLLENGERFAHRLLEGFDPHSAEPQLTHIATDGETYGHHHRYGEMALAYALDYIERKKLARITNYGEYLAKFPPSKEIEILENTAWSCVHGVGRWYRDCGCNSGAKWGWNQAWRTPLREAYDWLRDLLAPVYETEAAKLLEEDPWDARNAYAAVVLDRSPQAIADFLAPRSRGRLAGADQVQLLKLLEMQRNAMLMYTSCGWFFDDLSGIETVQTMQYAGRAIQLLEETTGRSVLQEFLAKLAAARSNDKDRGDGAAIFKAQVLSSQVDLPKVAAHYGISSLFETYRNNERVHCYQCERIQRRESKAGHLRAVTGVVRVTSTVTLETGDFAFGAIHLGGHNLTAAVTRFHGGGHFDEAAARLHSAFAGADIPAVIRLLDRDWAGAENTYTLRSLFRDEQRKILDFVLDDTLRDSEDAFQRLHDKNLPLMRFLGSMNVPPPRVFQVTAATALHTQLKRAFSSSTPPDPESIGALVQEAKSAGIELDAATLEFQLRSRIGEAAIAFHKDPKSLAALDNLLAWLRLRTLMPFPVHVWEAQNHCHATLKTIYPARVRKAAAGDPTAIQWLAAVQALLDALGMLIPTTAQYDPTQR